MPSRPVDLLLSPAEAAGDAGGEKQHREKGKQWHPGSVALTAHAEALLSTLRGRKHSFEKRSIWVTKNTSASAQGWAQGSVLPCEGLRLHPATTQRAQSIPETPLHGPCRGVPHGHPASPQGAG